ncbi:MAG: PAS domain-containing protein [Gemmatimonadales bacterium]
MTDDAERTSGENALERSHSLLHATLESTADGLLVVDRAGRVSGYNTAFLRLWRIPTDLAEHRDDAKLLAFVLDQLVDPAAFLSRVQDLYRTPDAVSFDVLLFQDGRVFERYSQPQRIAGEVVGRVWSFRDVTERRIAEEALRQSERWLRQVIDLVPVMIFAKSADGRFVLANQALADALGTTVERLIGRTDHAFVADPDQLAHLRSADLTVIETGRPLRVSEEPLTDAEGRTRLLETIRVPVTLPGREGAGVLGVATDTTERRQLEAELMQSQRMDAIGRLAGGIAHDFNNLLTAILGFSHALLEDLPDRDPRRDDLVNITTAAERAADLTRQLLAFSRRQVLQPRVVNINDLVRTLERLLRRVLGEDIVLEISLDPELAPVRADPSQLEQVIVNLAVNGREAMPRGGRLVIATRTLRENEAPEEVAALAAEGAGLVALAVSDSGTGMSAEVRQNIFEPFFTTKEQGTGLGLSMVYGIVKQTGGHIEVQSELGEGTSFTVYLPATRAVEEAPRPPEAALEPVKGATILLVEDEDAVRRLTKRLLAADGYQVIEAVDGEDALAVAGRHDGPIDLVLTDLVMPRMNGRELALAIQSRRPRIRVAFMSGYTADAFGRDTTQVPNAPFLAETL